MELFDKIEPVYYLDNEMKNIIKNIDVNLKRIEITNSQKRDFMITKCMIRSIHSSLSIEANSLSLFDVEKISQNKQIIGSKSEIQEVKNAIDVYSSIRKFNYKSENDFLKAHSRMMKYLVEDAGEYRTNPEGITRNNKLIYRAPDAIVVPELMKSLFDYLNKSNLNKLILGAIFHYYLVVIHPFYDGNGRMARFWMNLILMNYDMKFAFIPVDEEMYLNQEYYYEAIEKSHIDGNANAFIKFSLTMINDSLLKVIVNDGTTLNDTQNKIVELITNNNKITQSEIALILKLSARTIKRNFKVLKEKGIIKRIGSDKLGHWEVVNFKVY